MESLQQNVVDKVEIINQLFIIIMPEETSTSNPTPIPEQEGTNAPAEETTTPSPEQTPTV